MHAPHVDVVVYRYASVHASARLSATLTVHLERPGYPSPLTPRFQVTRDVETLWARYEGCRRGREPLTTMA